MASRSFRRVLGETHLERKCRFLFGLCLAALMIAAFSWVFVIAKSLVVRNTRSQARDLIDSRLLRLHWIGWVNENEKTITASKPFVQALTKDLAQSTESYQFEVLTLSQTKILQLENVKRPQDAGETALLKALENDLAAAEKAPKPRPEGLPEPGEAAKSDPRAAAAKIYREFSLPGEQRYVYYQPIVWQQNCTLCHQRLTSGESGVTTDLHQTDLPLHVCKVTIPYKETQAAIDETLAILIATTIATVVVAMLALYAIVKYVIVKPLKHLREVSEQVREGRMQQRANIHTGDEFEDLAESFNRMLRHLFDTQEEQRRLNSELEGSNDQLARMNVQLHEMNRVKSEFLANMSHELRTPLNSIIGFSDVLQGIDSLNDKQKRYVQNIGKSGRVLLDMINDILDLAKLESNKMEVRVTEFRIETVAHAQCDMVRSLTEEKNIDLTLDVPSDLAPLEQDQGKVQQILNNLLSNAIKFTPEGGRITVSIRRDEQERLHLIVADTGVGIAAADREIIFEKFRQGLAHPGRDNLTREFSGTGLGLSIVKELCKLLGGEVSVESELGKGSAFTVIVPWVYGASPPPVAAAAGESAPLAALSAPLHS